MRTRPGTAAPRPVARALALGVPLALVPTLLAAQARPVPPWERRSAPTLALFGGALYTGARGGPAAGARVDDGVGFDVQGSVGVSAFALGVGYQRTQHRLPGTTANVTYQGPYVEPRLAIAPYGSFTPYLSGRVGLLRQDVPATGLTLAGRTNVTLVGGGGGLLVALGRGVALDVGAMWTDVRARERRDVATQPVPGPFVGGTGSGVQARAGLTLGFDRWGR